MLIVLGIATSCGDNRGGDVPKVRALLEAISGVRVIGVVGRDEIWPLFGPTHIRAELEVRQNGRLVLCDLKRASSGLIAQFIIARVGKWSPLVLSETDVGQARYVAGCPTSVDVAPDSPFLELVPFALHSVSDVVAKFERLAELIESWPEEWTEVPARDGGWIRYRKVRSLNGAR